MQCIVWVVRVRGVLYRVRVCLVLVVRLRVEVEDGGNWMVWILADRDQLAMMCGFLDPEVGFRGWAEG